MFAAGLWRERAENRRASFGITMSYANMITALGVSMVWWAYTWSGLFPATSPRQHDQNLIGLRPTAPKG